MNAYAMSIEPHTNYLGPKASEEFDISMRLSMVGIGAVLQERDEYTTIREITPGGPASRSGKLNVGDRIVGVGQGAKATPTDVVGWRLDDVVALIRGTKDSVVLLDILPADASADAKHKIITLVRDKITLDQQSAKKSIIEVSNDPFASASAASNTPAPASTAADEAGNPASSIATSSTSALTAVNGAQKELKNIKSGLFHCRRFIRILLPDKKAIKTLRVLHGISLNYWPN